MFRMFHGLAQMAVSGNLFGNLLVDSTTCTCKTQNYNVSVLLRFYDLLCPIVSQIPKAEHGKTEDAPSEPGLEPKLTDVVAGWKSLIDVVSKFHVFGS